MPHFDLRHFLETLGSMKGEEAFVLQIGAMDGKTFDPVHEYIERFRWGGLLVEPVKEHFEKLRHTYSGNARLAFANVAIARHCGTVKMHRIPSEHIRQGSVPRWGLGVASFYTDRNALAFDEVRPFIAQERVDCTTLPELLRRHEVTRIDVLQVDAEGFDYQVLKQVDFNLYHPKVINIEIVNMPKTERTACKRILDAAGYLYVKAGYDLLAVSHAFFARAGLKNI